MKAWAIAMAGVLATAAFIAFTRVEAPQAVVAYSGHHCADLLVRTEVQLAVVPGVWNCLEPQVQALFKGTGDDAVVTASPFTGSAFIGCDSWLCVYTLTFDATTAATKGMDETTMTVWLDSRGLVSHAAIPKAVP